MKTRRNWSPSELKSWAELWTQIDNYVRAKGGTPGPIDSKQERAIADRIEQTIEALGMAMGSTVAKENMRRLHRERTSQGLREAIARGVTVGRPRVEIPEHWLVEVAEGRMHAAQIARLKHVSAMTVRRRVAELLSKKRLSDESDRSE